MEAVVTETFMYGLTGPRGVIPRGTHRDLLSRLNQEERNKNPYPVIGIQQIFELLAGLGLDITITSPKINVIPIVLIDHKLSFQHKFVSFFIPGNNNVPR